MYHVGCFHPFQLIIHSTELNVYHPEVLSKVPYY
jgi:hypothetical protein